MNVVLFSSDFVCHKVTTKGRVLKACRFPGVSIRFVFLLHCQNAPHQIMAFVKPPVILSAFLGYILGLQMECRLPLSPVLFLCPLDSLLKSTYFLLEDFLLVRNGTGFEMTSCYVPGRSPIVLPLTFPRTSLLRSQL